ncbi:MAG TPA: A24 family peptidase [Pseudomonadales bacterium]
MNLAEFYAYNLPFILIASGLFGMVFGSFLNVVIYRLPVMLQARWKQECTLLLEADASSTASAPFNLVFPNSHCPHCSSPIRAWQNIPVVSYLLLKGKCHHCKTPISWRYPAIEVVTGLAVLCCVWQWGLSWQALAASAMGCTLITLTMIDLDHQLLPDNLTLPLLWLGLIINSAGLFTDLESAVWGAVLGYLSLWSMYWLFKLLTGKEGMGYGDFKLLAALGAWLGAAHIPVIIILSTVAGSIIAGTYLLISRQSSNTTIPFGPFLAVAGWLSFFYGDSLISSYRQLGGF